MSSKKIDHKSIVAKDNSLVGLLAKFELSELRLIAFCLAHYDSRTNNNREIEARVDDLKEIFSMTTKDAYSIVRRAVIGINKNLMNILMNMTAGYAIFGSHNLNIK